MLKIGIIGFGRIGKVHARSIQTRVENACVLRICSPFMNPAMEAEAQKLGIQRWGTDAGELIHDPDIDAVLICSSTHTHAALSIEAAQAGKHIFCRKTGGPGSQADHRGHRCRGKSRRPFSGRLQPSF